MQFSPMTEISVYVARNYGQSAPENKREKPMNEQRFYTLVRWAENTLAFARFTNGDMVSGTSTVEITGQWLGGYEHTAIISTLVPSDKLAEILPAVEQLADTLKRTTYQDTVMVTLTDKHVAFV